MLFPQNSDLFRPKTLIYTLLVLAIVSLAPIVSFGQGSTLERDAYTLSTSAGTNFGSATIARVSGSGSGATGNGYFRFKMTTSLPTPFTSDKIAKATLKLYVSALTSGGSIDVYLVSATWAENTITHTSAPAAGTLVASAIPVPSAGSYLVIDLTNTAKAWWNNDTTNYGIVLKASASTPNVNVQFDTKETLNTSHDAKMEIITQGLGVADNAVNFTGNLAGEVTGTQSNTVVSNAVSANTGGAIVRRDVSGNFSAGTITANLNGNASTATSATNFSGSLAGDVTGTQSSTTIAANAVTNGKIANGAVTDAKIVSVSGSKVAGDITGNAASITGSITGGQVSSAVANATNAANATTANFATNAGNASTVTNGVYTNGSYADPSFITSLAGTKITGSVSLADLAKSVNQYTTAGRPAAAPANSGMIILNTTTNTLQLSDGANWTDIGAAAPSSFTGSLAGDVTGTQSSTVVSSVGGQTAANVASGTTAANGATDANTASAIVKRDGSGNFTAGTITAALNGNATSITGNINGTQVTGNIAGNAASITGSITGGQVSSQVADAVHANNADNATNATTVTNGVYSNGSYADPSFITSLAGSKITGSVDLAKSVSHYTTALRPPAAPANNGQIIFNETSNTLQVSDGANWTDIGAAAPSSFTGSLAGDVTGTQSSTVVSLVGTKTAASVASATDAANGATDANTASALVKRDASGNFTAGTITATLNGNATSITGNINGTQVTGNIAGNAASITGSITGGQVSSQVADAVHANNADLATNAGNANTVTNGVYTNGSYADPSFISSLAGSKITGSVSLADIAKSVSAYTTALRPAAAPANSGQIILNTTTNTLQLSDGANWTDIGAAAPSSFTGSLAGDVTGTQSSTVVASVGGQTAANVASGTTAANAATDANTASAIVKRDGLGNFTAGTITAALNGNAATATSATTATTATNATNFTGSLAGDVTGTQGATAVALVGGKTAASVASATDAANGATDANTASALVKRDASGNFTAGTITAALNGNATSITGNINGTQVSGNIAGNAASITGSITGGQVSSQVADALHATNADLATNATNAGNANTVTNGVYTNGSYVDPSFITSLAGSKITSSVDLAKSVSHYTTALRPPAAPANNGQIIFNETSNTLQVSDGANWTDIGAAAPSSFTGSLAGDVTGTQSSTVVSSVGGQTAANVASGTTAANGATDANTASAIVKRDGSGNFTAGTITAALNGNAATATTATTATNSTNFTGSLAGDVTGTQGTTAVALVGGKTAASVASATDAANGATDANTASAIVKRDASGNFSAGTITAALNGNAATATTATNAGSASTVTNGVYTVGDQTIGGNKTFSNAILGNLSGNVTGDLTGNVTGNVTGNLTGTASLARSVVHYTSGTLPAADAGNNGQIIFNETSNTFQVSNGSVWTDIGAAAPSGFTGSLAGDVTGTQNATVIAANAVTNGKIADGAVSDAKITAVSGSKVTGNISGNAASITGSITGSQVTGNITGNAASITGSITESQVTNLTTDLAGKVSTSEVGAANGVASLDATIKVPTAQIPTLPYISNASAAANQVVATPDGSAGSPSPRALVANDVPSLPQSKITNLTSDLAGKASDSTVVHLTGNETIAGTKTFSSTISGSITGNAATATTASSATTATTATNATNFTGSLGGDVTGTQGATALSTTGVTAGSFTNATITVDAKGRISAASSNLPSGGSQSASGTTTSTSYTPTLTGATGASTSVTVSGTHTALVTVSTQCSNGTNNKGCLVSFAISGATTLGASDTRAFGVDTLSTGTIIAGGGTYLVTLSSGTSTFTANYRAGLGGTATFAASSIIVQVY